MSKHILILGANGFIGYHLTQAILNNTDWHISALDISSHKIEPFLANERLTFKQANMLTSMDWIEQKIQEADIVLPLVAIATPQTYVTDPLKVFELDFEANLPIVRLCAKYQTRIVFPSTSEVYGLSPDTPFKEYDSPMMLGPVSKPRWIYATCKQLMDRIIIAYGEKEGLPYTLFRPFNWYGPKLDDLSNTQGQKSRVLTQFLSQILNGQDLVLVDGGAQRRCFTYVSDGIDGLMAILHNEGGCADNRIFNLGNPFEDYSIKEMAKLLVNIAKTYPAVAAQANRVQLIEKSSESFYGKGYQDVSLRVPSIEEAQEHLGFDPKISLEQGLRETLKDLAHAIPGVMPA